MNMQDLHEIIQLAKWYIYGNTVFTILCCVVWIIWFAKRTRILRKIFKRDLSASQYVEVDHMIDEAIEQDNRNIDNELTTLQNQITDLEYRFSNHITFHNAQTRKKVSSPVKIRKKK